MAVIKVTNSKATLSKAISYITKEEKIEERLVSGVNCNSKTALDEMMATKEQFNKLEGRQYYHYVQSFSTEDNIDHQKAHRIALELAESRFKGFEVLIATHNDKDHVHSHIIVNSVSCENGLKFQSSKKDLAELKKDSDKICEREGLSVIEKADKDVLSSFNQKKYKTLEKAVEGSQKSYLLDLWKDCSQSLSKATSKEQFIKDMEQKGYGVNWVDTRKNITFITPEGKKVRNTNLAKTFKNEKFTKEGIENEIKRNRENARGRAEGNQLSNRGGNSNSANQITRADIERSILFGQGANEISSIRNDEPIKSFKEINGEIRNREREPNGAVKEVRGIEKSERKEVKRNNTRLKTRNQGNEGLKLQEDRASIKDNNEPTREPQGVSKVIEQFNSRNKENRAFGLEGQSETICPTSGNISRSDTSSVGGLSADDLLNQIANGLKVVEQIAKEQHKSKEQLPKERVKSKNKNRGWDIDR